MIKSMPDLCSVWGGEEERRKAWGPHARLKHFFLWLSDDVTELMLPVVGVTTLFKESLPFKNILKSLGMKCYNA